MVSLPHRPGRATRVVAFGASAGGVATLSRIAAGLQPDIAAAMLVVMHIPPAAPSALSRILERSGALPAVVPRDREPVVTGRIYVAPPDRHLLVEDCELRVTSGPWENGRRPSIDVLLRSVATWYGKAAAGVVLSGALDDGSSGLAAIRRAGGVAIVQDPEEADIPFMPRNALAAVPDAEVLRSDEIAARLIDLAGTARPTVVHTEREESDGRDESATSGDEIAIALGDRVTPEHMHLAPAGLSCPDCDGSLFAMRDPAVERFRCRVGHAWSAGALAASQRRRVEIALYTALRALEDEQRLQDRWSEATFARGREVGAQTRVDRRQRRALMGALRGAITNLADPQRGSHERSSLDAPDDEPLDLG